MFEVIAEDLVEGRRVAGVLVGGDLVRRCSGDRHGRAEERFGGFLIAGLAHGDVDQGAVAVDRPVQVLPLTDDLDGDCREIGEVCRVGYDRPGLLTVGDADGVGFGPGTSDSSSKPMVAAKRL